MKLLNTVCLSHFPNSSSLLLTVYLVLAALSLHPSQIDGNSQQISNDSASLWGTLRKSLIAMELADLAAKARPGTDLEVFRRAGFEF